MTLNFANSMHEKKEANQRLSKDHGSCFPLVNVIFGITLIVAATTMAVPPEWWNEHDVLDATQNQDNRAAIVVGQVKNMATTAMAQMEENFPGGAGEAIRNMVGVGEPPLPLTSWRAHLGSDNQFIAATTGQVKNVAKPFYDRLIELGLRRLDQGYPWNTDTSSEENLALANAGQLKNVFAFTIPDLTLLPDEDADGDGLPDSWELSHGLNPSNPADALVDLDGDGLTNLQEFNLGLDPRLWGLPASVTSDYDGDGVADTQDAIPDDSAQGVMAITISAPLNNAVLY